MRVYALIPEGRGRIGRLTTAIQRRLQLPLGIYWPLVAVQLGYRAKTPPEWTVSSGGWRIGRVWFGWAAGCSEWEETLFRNGVFFARFSLPFCIAIAVRWSADPVKKSHAEMVLGWRPNGVPGASMRRQSDVTSANGYDIPNPGQARGWDDGWR